MFFILLFNYQNLIKSNLLHIKAYNETETQKRM